MESDDCLCLERMWHLKLKKNISMRKTFLVVYLMYQWYTFKINNEEKREKNNL